jgi:hypothetical protein
LLLCTAADAYVVLVIGLPYSAAVAACAMRIKSESVNSEDEEDSTSVATQRELAETQQADLGIDDYEADDDTSVFDEEVQAD